MSEKEIGLFASFFLVLGGLFLFVSWDSLWGFWKWGKENKSRDEKRISSAAAVLRALIAPLASKERLKKKVFCFSRTVESCFVFCEVKEGTV